MGSGVVVTRKLAVVVGVKASVHACSVQAYDKIRNGAHLYAVASQLEIVAVECIARRHKVILLMRRSMS